MRRNKHVLFFLNLTAAFGLAICGAVIVFAETITLRTGRVLTGEIIETGEDYIKIQTDGGVFKVQNKHIAGYGSPLGAAQAQAENVDVEAMLEQLADELSDEEWEKRLDDYDRYFRAVGRLQDRYTRSLSQSVGDINAALDKKNIPDAHRAANTVITDMAYIQREMDSMTLYPELKPYHEKVQNAIRLTMKSVNAWKLGDQHVYHKYRRDSIRTMIDSMEEYAFFSRIVWSGKRAKNSMDEMIRRMKARLENEYY